MLLICMSFHQKLLFFLNNVQFSSFHALNFSNTCPHVCGYVPICFLKQSGMVPVNMQIWFFSVFVKKVLCDFAVSFPLY